MFSNKINFKFILKQRTPSSVLKQTKWKCRIFCVKIGCYVIRFDASLRCRVTNTMLWPVNTPLQDYCYYLLLHPQLHCTCLTNLPGLSADSQAIPLQNVSVYDKQARYVLIYPDDALNIHNWETANLVVCLGVFNDIRLDQRIFLRLRIHREGLLKETLPYGKFWNTGWHFRRRIKQIIKGLRYDFRVGMCFDIWCKFKSSGGKLLGATRDIKTYLTAHIFQCK